MAAIQTTGLTKRYGKSILAVDDLDLTVEEGEVFGFLGPNGARKSTTINMLLDFVRPTEGSATVLGPTRRPTPTRSVTESASSPKGRASTTASPRANTSSGSSTRKM